MHFLLDTRPVPDDPALRMMTIPGALADLDAMAAAARGPAEAARA